MKMRIKKSSIIFFSAFLLVCLCLPLPLFSSCSLFNSNLTVSLHVIGSSKNITLSNYEYIPGKAFQAFVKNIDNSEYVNVQIINGNMKLIPNEDYVFNNDRNMIDINPGILSNEPVYITLNISKQSIVPFNFLNIDPKTNELKGFVNGVNLNLYTKLTIPNNVIKIGKNAFSNLLSPSNSTIKEIELNEGLQTIDEYAFFHCSGLTNKLILPSTLTAINDHAFDGCTNLLGPITFPQNLVEINDFAFFECSSLTGDIHFPDSLTALGNYAFSRTNFDGQLKFPPKLTRFGESVFAFCQKLKWDFVLPELPEQKEGETEIIKEIPAGVFAYCTSFAGELILKDDSISKIGNSAFSNCKHITKISFSKNLKDIGSNAFKQCSDLKTIRKWGENLVSIGSGAFSECNNLSSILVFPNSLRKIGESCFANCTSLPEIIFNDELTHIYDKAFLNCSNLSKINMLPPYLLEIGNEAFSNCKNMKINSDKFSAANDMVRIGDKAFFNCTSLNTRISLGNISNQNFYLGKSAFENANINDSVVLSGCIQVIPDRCYYSDSNITEMHLNLSTIEIGNNTFQNCRNLETLFQYENFSNPVAKLAKIGDYAFAETKHVFQTDGTGQMGENFYIYKSVKSIGNYAFYNTNRSTSEIHAIFISDGPLFIGKQAFVGWNNIDSITIEVLPGSKLPIWMTSSSVYGSEVFKGLAPANSNAKGIVRFSIESGLIQEQTKKDVFNILTKECGLDKDKWEYSKT